MKLELEDMPQIFNYFDSPDASNHEVAFERLKGFNEEDVDTFAVKYFGELLTSKVGNWKELITRQGLYLDNNQITALPAEIGKLGALKWLHLGNNQISALPADFGKLVALEMLNLNNNQISDLPAEICKLSALEWLDLSNNQLTTLPAEICRLGALEWLDLDNNQLNTLPAEIGKLVVLQTLFLRNSPISKAEQKRIIKLLPNCEVYF